MEGKELKIVPPEGYVVDKSNSTFECIKFKKKSLTYEDVAKKLFGDNVVYYIDGHGVIHDVTSLDEYCTDPTNATSEKQLEKLLAINKLMNVAKYLNGDWKPDWKHEAETKWHIMINCENQVDISYSQTFCFGCVYFKSEKLAQQAIEILGEDTIRLALSTDW